MSGNGTTGVPGGVLRSARGRQWGDRRTDPPGSMVPAWRAISYEGDSRIVWLTAT